MNKVAATATAFLATTAPFAAQAQTTPDQQYRQQMQERHSFFAAHPQRKPGCDNNGLGSTSLEKMTYVDIDPVRRAAIFAVPGQKEPKVLTLSELGELKDEFRCTDLEQARRTNRQFFETATADKVQWDRGEAKLRELQGASVQQGAPMQVAPSALPPPSPPHAGVSVFGIPIGPRVAYVPKRQDYVDIRILPENAGVEFALRKAMNGEERVIVDDVFGKNGQPDRILPQVVKEGHTLTSIANGDLKEIDSFVKGAIRTNMTLQVDQGGQLVQVTPQTSPALTQVSKNMEAWDRAVKGALAGKWSAPDVPAAQPGTGSQPTPR
jgi:hypothetical protein